MRLWLRWALAMLVGEAIGFGVAGLVAWAAFSSLGDVPASLALVILAGGIEGAIVGYAQARCIPVGRARWTAFTAAAAVLAWTAGMLLGPRLPTESLLLAAPLLLIGMGLLMGMLQWLELRRHAPRAWRWIVANAVAWPMGLLWTFGASAIVTEATPMALGAALIVGSGIAMGLTVGAVTGVAIERIIRRTSR